MSDKIKGQRLTKTQSRAILMPDNDIPVIPPLRIKLKSTEPVDKTWLRGVHGDPDGDSVVILKMKAGGDIVHGFVGDDLQEE